MLNRAFDHDQRHQRSFAFKFDYYTIVEEDIQPMPWQRTDPPSRMSAKSPDHIPISRCSSVLALSLAGGQVRKLRNAARRAKTQYGYIYDPWSPVRDDQPILLLQFLTHHSGMCSIYNAIQTTSIAWTAMTQRSTTLMAQRHSYIHCFRNLTMPRKDLMISTTKLASSLFLRYVSPLLPITKPMD
jgi:hypothetical protein